VHAVSAAAERVDTEVELHREHTIRDAHAVFGNGATDLIAARRRCAGAGSIEQRELKVTRAGRRTATLLHLSLIGERCAERRGAGHSPRTEQQS
jgi:hypothetical protein